MNLFWIDSSNFGDALNPIIYKKITGFLPNLSRNSPKILALGSILHEAMPGDVVWGTGVMSPAMLHKFDDTTKFLAVRGPLTAAFVRDYADIYPTIWGDPASLLPIFIEPAKEKRWKIGIVPHYIDSNVRMGSGEAIVTLKSDTDPLTMIQNITSCEVIVSSSLHGIVVAEAYGIPAIWAEFSDNVAGGGFKFRDYYGATGRDVKPVDMRTSMSVGDVILQGRRWTKPDFNPAKLLRVCPFLVDQWDYPAAWPERGRMIGGMVKRGESVIELGCGIAPIRPYLPDGCYYQASDKRARDNGTLVIDLDLALPAISHYNVAVFSGVLEYLANVPRVIQWISQYVDTIIASYAVSENNGERLSHGWTNSYTTEQFFALFAGFTPTIINTWQGQKVVRFDKYNG